MWYFKHFIHVHCDESKFAQYAFKFYAEHLHKPSYRVILYHALENLFAKDISAARLAEYNSKCEKKTAALTELYTKLAEDRQIEVEIRVEKVGVRPEHAISDFITQEKPKFVVTGTRGVGVVRRTILGSTSDFILHHANCPVVICTMEDPWGTAWYHTALQNDIFTKIIHVTNVQSCTVWNNVIVY